MPLYPFFLEGVVFQNGLMQPDGIHPNARGVAEVVRRMLPASRRPELARARLHGLD